uniref:Uncharacterized protein n=1 Tax=Clastoptera arizonana TaxID=38151 RepID=A0A1B6DH53_9HEMI
MKDTDFIKVMTVSKSKAWESFILVVENFLGNHKPPNYEEIVQNMLTNFQTLGANISIKLYYLRTIIWINFRIIYEIIVRNKESQDPKSNGGKISGSMGLSHNGR